MRQKSPADGKRGGGRSKRLPGRPRSEQARVSILRSALKLLGENGFSDLTIEAVAAHAFASSATRKLHFPDTGSVHTDMSQQMRQVIKVFRSPRGRILAAILAAGQSDRALIAAFRERFMKPRRQEAYATLRRGIQRGDLRKDVDMDLLLDSLYGPIYMRFLIRHAKLTPDFVDHLCELVLSGARPSRESRAHAAK